MERCSFRQRVLLHPWPSAFFQYPSLFFPMFFLLHFFLRFPQAPNLFLALTKNASSNPVMTQVDVIGGMNAGFNVGVVRLLRLAKIARALSLILS